MRCPLQVTFLFGGICNISMPHFKKVINYYLLRFCSLNYLKPCGISQIIIGSLLVRPAAIEDSSQPPYGNSSILMRLLLQFKEAKQ
jgi:hypothetical protein